MTPSESTATPIRDFGRAVHEAHPSASSPEQIDWLMLNVGLRCDLSCAHCHHACSPVRTEVMSRETMLDALSLAERIQPSLLDITGGEPELYPHLRELISLARSSGLAVRVRTNLVALAAPEAADLPAFFADQGVAHPGFTAGRVGGPDRGAAGQCRGVGDVYRRASDARRPGLRHRRSAWRSRSPTTPRSVSSRDPKARSRASSARPSSRSACASTHCSRFPTCRLAGIGSA